MLGVLSSRLRDATEEQALSKMPNGWGRGALGGGGGVEGSQNRRRRASPSGAVCRAVGGTGLRTDDACRARSRQPLVPRRNSWVLRTVEWTGKLGRSHFYSYSTTTTSSSFGRRVGGGGKISARQERAAALVGNPLRNTLQGGMVGRPGYTRLCLRGFVSTSASLSCCHNESCNDSNGFLFMQEVQPASGLMQDPPA